MESKILCEISCLLLVLYNSLTSSTEVSNVAHDIFVQPSMYYAYQYEIK